MWGPRLVQVGTIARLTLLVGLSSCGADERLVVKPLAFTIEARGHFGGPEPLQTNYVLHLDGTALVTAVHRRHVTVIDTLGAVLRHFGRDGLGPSEFRSSYPAGTVGDSVWINDRVAGRYTVYHPASGDARSARIPILGGRPQNIPLDWSGSIVGLLGDGRALAIGYPRHEPPNPIQVMLAVAQRADTVDRLLLTTTWQPDCTLPNRGQPTTMTACQRPHIFVAPNGESATALEPTGMPSQGVTLRLTRVAVTGDTLMRSVITFPARAMTPELLDSLVQAHSRLLQRPVTKSGFDPPQRLAAVRFGHQGNDGSLWLGGVKTSQTQMWFLVSPEGMLLGHVGLDPDLTIGAVSHDGAWAVRDLENGDAQLVRIVIQP